MIFKYFAFGEISDCILKKDKYATNGRLSLQLFDALDGTPFAIVTVNIPDVELEQDEIMVKNYSENSGMDDWMIENGLAIDTGKLVSIGYVTGIPIMKLTEKCLTIL